MLFPKNCKSKAGVIKMPAMLLMQVLHNADATFPPDAEVRIMHILIVVGKHVIIKRPSRRDFGNKLGANASIPLVNGSPARNGQAPKVMAWIIPFNFILAKALVSSANLRLNPERRKMEVTPYFPMKSSGLNTLPFFPS